MRMIVTASQAPFFHGGGERHVENLCSALREHGHEVALLRLPFKFSPAADIDAIDDILRRIRPGRAQRPRRSTG